MVKRTAKSRGTCVHLTYVLKKSSIQTPNKWFTVLEGKRQHNARMNSYPPNDEFETEAAKNAAAAAAEDGAEDRG